MSLVAEKVVRIPKTAEIVAGRIRKAIIRGELKPGDNLPPEAQLIARFEVSRPTLREAIRILESERLILISRGARSGAIILTPTAEMVSKAAGIALQYQGATIGDIYEARTLIEPSAARLAAIHYPAEASEALLRQTEVEHACADAKDIANLRREISNFHRVLLERSGNITLAVIAYALEDLVDRHQALVYQSQPIDSESRWAQIRYGIKSHERLAALIGAGDGEGAEQHWSRHMTNAGHFWLDHVAQTAVIDLLD